ncbi:MAG: hypothetical protein LBE12_00815 [Planctomycetaceae bacterium]|nr:hypothetical protein [Planctomycetaceae bacterium]
MKIEFSEKVMDIKRIFGNIFDAEILKFNLQHVSIFIAVYENMVNMVTENVKGFYLQGFSQLDLDGSCSKSLEYSMNHECYHEDIDGYRNYYSREYKEKIIDHKVNGKRNILLATMNWFVENQAMTQEEFENFLIIRDHRNKYVHEMTKFLFEGLPESSQQTFIDLLQLYAKLDKWWIN